LLSLLSGGLKLRLELLLQLGLDLLLQRGLLARSLVLVILLVRGRRFPILAGSLRLGRGYRDFWDGGVRHGKIVSGWRSEFCGDCFMYDCHRIRLGGGWFGAPFY